MVEITGKGETRLSARYAAALYALAAEQGILNDVTAQMETLGQLIANDARIARLVQNPMSDGPKIAHAINAALTAGGFLPVIVNFVNVAIANRRLRDLPELITGFAAYAAEKRGETIAEITSAHALTDLQRTQLRARLTESGFGAVKFVERVDAALLGGLVLKIGAKIYDTSLKSRLNRLNHSLKGAA